MPISSETRTTKTSVWPSLGTTSTTPRNVMTSGNDERLNWKPSGSGWKRTMTKNPRQHQSESQGHSSVVDDATGRVTQN